MISRTPRAGWLLPLAVVAVTTAYFVIDRGMIDLRVYAAGGDALLHGDELYREAMPGSGLPFTYPPFAAILFTPLAVLNHHVAEVVWSVAALAALGYVVAEAAHAVGWRLDPWRFGALMAVAVWFEPVRETVSFGQVNTFVMALVVADVCGRLPRVPRGVLVGLAAAVKLTPLIFVAYLLLGGRVRAALNAVATVAVTVLVGFAVVPSGAWTYWTELAFDSTRVGEPEFVSNQSVMALITRLNGSAEGVDLAWLLAGGVVGLVGLLTAVAVARRGQEMLGVVTCGTTALMVSPISWSHHYVWAVPAAVLLAARAMRDRRAVPLAVGWVVLFVVAPMWRLPYRYGAEFGWSRAQLVVGSTYLLLTAAWVGVLAVSEARRLRSGRTGRNGGAGRPDPDEPAPALSA